MEPGRSRNTDRMEGSFIYVVRHGAVPTDGAAAKRYIGQLDAPLSDRGVQQARRLGEELNKLPIEKVYASDLRRSFQAAEIIADPLGLKPEIIPALREVKLGSWEGLTFEEVSYRYPDEFRRRGENLYHHRPPGGENFADCRTRVLNAYYQIAANAARQILIVGHAGVNRLILCDLLGMAPENLFQIAQNYGCLNLIELSNLGQRVRLINHLF